MAVLFNLILTTLSLPISIVLELFNFNLCFSLIRFDSKLGSIIHFWAMFDILKLPSYGSW
jgi:hypothetical protein